MGESSRICINLPKDLEEELRVLYADMISKTRKNISFSKFFSYILREVVIEKEKQQWYEGANREIIVPASFVSDGGIQTLYH